MNSFNHYSLGSVGEWLYRHVAGIELDPAVPGFKQFIVRPFLGGGFKHAGARFESIHGSISSRWSREGNCVALSVHIPANTVAQVYVPADPGSEVFEGGAPAGKAAGVRSVGRAGGFALFAVQSGHYEFTSTVALSPATGY
jgi:alpha-L-rhamnosidase